jgi:hypothetical protein
MAVKKEEFVVWESKSEGKVLHEGKALSPPEGWIFVKSGDAGLTRRLKASGDYWIMVHRRRNRVESIGIWIDADIVDKVKAKLETERSNPEYQKKIEAGKKYRQAKQDKYEVEFRSAVLSFLAFSDKWSVFAEKLADGVTRHAVPVGSGTVARTQRIPLERRAEAAVIAWMRHQTTAYDYMTIARIKGERRDVRRRLAERSRQLLAKYRLGEEFDISKCPLAEALKEVS